MGTVRRNLKKVRSWLYGSHRQAANQYRRDRKEWLKKGGEITRAFPILTDYQDSAGRASGHYFHQDLLVASLIHANNPARHIDVGSRIDGFVAHVAAFREIEVIDIRPLESTEHPNIKFLQMDLMSDAGHEITDSLSCLHAIEHFGLGRYGDPVCIDGHVQGIENLVKMVKPGGDFYISFPIGRKDEVHFNAHRILDPRTILDIPAIRDQMRLRRFDYVSDDGALHKDREIAEAVGRFHFGCGIYWFEKSA